MLDRSLTGRKPPEEIRVNARFNESKDLIEKIFKIIKIKKVKAEYIRRSDETALTNYLEWLTQRYNVIYDEKFDE